MTRTSWSGPCGRPSASCRKCAYHPPLYHARTADPRPLTLWPGVAREGATAYVCRDAATNRVVSSVFLLENADSGEAARPAGTPEDRAALGMTPEAQAKMLG